MSDKAVIKALKELVALDYDAIEAYDAAIDRLDDKEAAKKLESFKQDHVRHTANIGDLVRKRGETPPDGPDFKRILTKGKVVLADLIGDKTILTAMSANEKITNVAYDKARGLDDLQPNELSVINANYADEQRHKAWIDQHIKDKATA